MDLPPNFPSLIALPGIAGPRNKSISADHFSARQAYRTPELVQKFVQDSNGAKALCAPTAGGNPLALAEFGIVDAAALHRSIFTALTAALPADVLIGGEMSACLFGDGQYDEEKFDDALSAYRQHASMLRDEKAGFLVFRAADDLAEVRTALIAARECCDLPFFATIFIDEDLRTPADNSVLASLVTLQALGISALGFCAKEPEFILQALRRAAPYAEIPLIADLSLCRIGDRTQYLAQIRQAQHTGASLFFYASPAPVSIGEVNAVIGLCQAGGSQEEEVPALDETEPYEFIAASHTDAFFFDLSVDFPPHIRFDQFAAAVLEAENAGADLIRVDVANEDEADILLANAYMIRLPLCLSCENPELLERIVRSYVGRLMIERPQIANLDDFLHYLSSKYGCILWG